MFVPFVNANYRNTWSDHLYWRTPGDSRQVDIHEYYDEKFARTRKEENVIENTDEWWANRNIICNVHKESDEVASQYWGDQFLAPLRDMMHELCRQRDVPDCEFFINKRDYPHLKVNKDSGKVVEPYGFIFDKDDRDPAQASAHRWKAISRPDRGALRTPGRESISRKLSHLCSDRLLLLRRPRPLRRLAPAHV
jgi:hypothetical protein